MRRSVCALCGRLRCDGTLPEVRSICAACVRQFYGLTAKGATPSRRKASRYLTAVIIKSICAWCGQILRQGVEPPTHSICDACLCELVGVTPAELEQQRREWAAEEEAQ
jgi:hypothetical protein